MSILLPEQQRLKALSSYQILDTVNEKEYDDLAELAKFICNVPIALITFLDENRQWFKSCFGLSISETSRDISFCQYTIMDDEILVIKNATKHPLFKENPLVTQEPFIRFYAGAPLITPSGHRLGSLCVIDRQPRELNDDQRKALRTLADAVMTNLNLRYQHKEANENALEVQKANKELEELNHSLKLNKAKLENKVKEVSVLREKEKSQAKIFKHFIENAEDLIFNIDTTLCFSYVNPTTIKYTGYSRNELEGMQYWQLIRSDFQQKVRQFYQQKLADHIEQSYIEFPIITKEGKEIYLGQKVKIEFDNGEFRNVKAIARDITEKYEAEKILLEKDELLEETQELARMGGWELVLFSGELIFTKEVYKILGIEENQPVSPKLILEMASEEDRMKVESAIDTVRNTGKSYHLEFQLKKKNGEQIWVKSHAKIKYKDGLPFKIAGTIQDITQRKKMEDERKKMLLRLATIIENINGAVLLENENRQIVLVNNQFCDYFQIPIAPAEMIGLDCSDAAENSMHLMQYPDDFVAKVHEILQDRLPVYNEEVYFKDGRITERDYVPLYIEQKYVGHLWLYRDVTWKKKHELELTKAKKSAEEAAVVKEQFLSTMSHEIRTPLNAVLGITQLMLNQKPDQAQKHHLELLKFSADNLMALINDILDFNKIDSGNLQLESLSFNLHHQLKGIIETFKFKASEKGIILNLHIGDEVPVYVIGDQVRMGQILVNLVSNALKFTEEGSVTLSVNTAADSKLSFKVIDTGIGIDENKINKVFERFSQADQAVNKKYGGTGLGLAISKKLVELMQGRLQVTSEPGKGSCFEFAIYLPQGEPEEINVNEELPDLRFLKLKVLVVEDNEINMFVAISFLEMMGIDADKAEDGDEGLRKIKENEYDLVLLDLQMPGLSGFEVTERVRRQKKQYFKDLPIIALTATSMENVGEEVISKGMNDYLAKPFEQQDLYQKIANYLSKEKKEKLKRLLSQ